MNKSFKVVFNKARGALMVVNEVTSCVQAKGTKTVIATAVALVAGAAVAAPEISTTPDVDTTVSGWAEVPAEGVITTDKKIDWADVKADGQYHYKNNAGQSAFTTLTKEKGAFAGKLWVSASGKSADATGLEVTGEGVELTNNGEIYVTTDKEGVEWKNEAMLAEDNAKAVNANKIVVKNAYGMRVGRSAPAEIENAGTIIVEEQGVGMELGGGAASVGSVATNNGSIIVGDIAEGKYGHGVLIKDAKEVVFNNNGLIQVGKGATAIDVQLDGETSVEINLGEKSQIDGLIKIGDGTKVALNAKGMTGKLKVQAADGTTTFNVADGSTVELVDGQKSVFETVNVEKGTLTASIWKDDNHMKDVVVGEEGVFNITKLNSGGDKDHLDTDPHDTLLVHGSTWNLNGGELLVANGSFAEGKMKVGTETATGEVNFNGDYTLSRLEIGLKGTVNVGKVGEGEAAGLPRTLTVKDLSFHYRGDNTETGSVTVNEDSSLVVTGTIGTENAIPSTVENKTLLTVKDGATVETSAANVFAKNDGGYSSTLTDTWNRFVVTESGSTLMLSGINEFTNDDYKNYADAVVGADLVLNGTLTDADQQDLATIYSYAGLNSTIAVNKAQKDAEDKTQVSAELTGDVGVGAIGVDAGTKTITITGDHELLVRGMNGKVIEGSDVVETLDVDKLTLGAYETDKGIVNAENLVVDYLDVVGDFTAKKVTVNANGKASTDNRFEALSIKGDGTFTVETGGTLKVSELGVQNFEMKQGSTLVLGNRLQAEQPVATRTGDITYTEQIQTTVSTSADMIVTTNDNGRELLKAVAGDAYDATKSGLYVDDQIAVNATTGKLLISANDDKGFGAVGLGANSVAVIDVANFTADKAIFVTGESGLHVNEASKIFIKGADRIGSFTLVEGGTVNSVDVVNGVLQEAAPNAWLDYAVANDDANKKTFLNVAFDEKVNASGEVKDFAKTVLTNGSESLGVVNAIGTTFVDKAGQLTEAGEEALDEYMALPVVAGTYNAAYDAAEQVWNTVGAHNIDRTAGKTNGVWADVFYSANEAGDMYGSGYGYEADVYGGVLGYDYTAACGGKIGAALTIGTSDVDAKGDFVGDYGNDADFWGLSIYASKDITEKMIVSADVTYLSLDNDIKGSVAGASVDESIDSSVISVGLRADWKAYESSAFEVVPHAGIRYAQIDVDDYREMDGESLDVLEMPIGVAFNGKFETAGMKFVPTLDFTVVPQIGDTEVHPLNGDTLDVLNNTYNTTLGISAEYGDFTFGVAAKYGFGTDDRSNAGVKVNATYAF